MEENETLVVLLMKKIGNTLAPLHPETDAAAVIYDNKTVKDILDSLPDFSKFILRTGDTMSGQLKFNTTKLPILDLHLDKNASNVFTLTTNGSIFVGDGTSDGGARVYYCRKVNNLNKAILAAVSVGFNPLDNNIWQTTKDYGIKFDVNVAPLATAPSAERQVASFHVGVNGAVVGYSGDASKAINDNCIYRVLDSNNISKDEYIKSLEQRISDLEAKIDLLLPKEDNVEVE